MTDPIIKQLPGGQVELVFTVTPDEAKPYLDQAVTDLSEKRPIKGFRPGKASYDDIKRAYGEMTIYEAALERLVRANYVRVVLEKQLDTIGSPEIKVEKMVPGQDIVFNVTANLMPGVTELADYSKPQVDSKRKEVTKDALDHAIEDLQKMRRTEVASDAAATKDDLAVIDLEILQNGVMVEGGVSRDYRVYLNEDSYIPGFADKLVGAKKGDEKSFELDFPADHYNKQLAGKPTTFKVNVKEIYRLEMPKLDDEFAKSLGLESADKLRELMKENLQKEQDQKADEAAEIELLEKLVKASKFTDIPNLLVNEEVRRMIAELSHSLEERGMNMDDYLASLKKKPEDLQMDFIPRAMDRIKTAVILKEISKRENVEVTDAEVEAEQDRIIDGLKPGDTEARTTVASPEYADYIKAQLKNQKILKVLKEKGIKS
ncbi:MAG: trigger factor [Patescibacteria group bacterium]